MYVSWLSHNLKVFPRFVKHTQFPLFTQKFGRYYTLSGNKLKCVGIHYLSHANINFVLRNDRCLCLLVRYTNIDISLMMTPMCVCIWIWTGSHLIWYMYYINKSGILVDTNNLNCRCRHQHCHQHELVVSHGLLFELNWSGISCWVEVTLF